MTRRPLHKMAIMDLNMEELTRIEQEPPLPPVPRLMTTEALPLSPGSQMMGRAPSTAAHRSPAFEGLGLRRPRGRGIGSVINKITQTALIVWHQGHISGCILKQGDGKSKQTLYHCLCCCAACLYLLLSPPFSPQPFSPSLTPYLLLFLHGYTSSYTWIAGRT